MSEEANNVHEASDGTSDQNDQRMLGEGRNPNATRPPVGTSADPILPGDLTLSDAGVAAGATPVNEDGDEKKSG